MVSKLEKKHRGVDVDWAVILVKVENYVNVFFGSLDGD